MTLGPQWTRKPNPVYVQVVCPWDKTIRTSKHMLKVGKKNKSTIKTPEWRQSHHSGAFIVDFEHISHLFLVFLLLTLSMFNWLELESMEI